MRDNFDYKPINYDNYTDVNELPIREDEGRDVIGKDMPDFMRGILGDTCISDNGKITFMRRFGIYYLTDPDFRTLTQKYVFLFFDREYAGAYPSENEAYSMGRSLREIKNKRGSIYLPRVEIIIEHR